MRYTHLINKRTVSLAAFAFTSVVSSFVIGVQTAGEVQPVRFSEAHQANMLQALPGDMDGDGELTADDAILALQCYEDRGRMTPQAYRADPDQNGTITISDLYVILHALRP